MLPGLLLADGNWKLAFNDPTPLAWVIVGCDAMAALLCFQCFRRRNRLVLPVDARRFGTYWLLVFLFMLLMAVNKQLDLQVALNDIGVRLAHDKEWFGGSTVFKVLFFGGVALIGLAWLGWLAVLSAGLWTRVWLAGLGVFLVLLILLLRFAAIYLVPLPMTANLIGPVQVNHALELFAIFVVALGAVVNLMLSKSSRPLVSQAMT